jgi:hypothetical protein
MPALIQRLESRLLLTAVNLSGASQFSGSASGTPHSSLPGAQVVTPTAGPDSVGQLTGFSASAASTSQISLTWNSVSGATSYNIYRGTSSNGENSTPIASGIAGTSFTDVGLNAATTYYYTAAAVDSSGPGAQSAEVSATPASSDMGVYDDTSSAIVYSQGQNGDGLNGWDTSSDPADFGGGEHSSNAYSGSFVINFQGTDFEWMGEKGPDFGIANLYIDGQLVGTADSYNPTVLNQQVLYSVSGLSDGVHCFEAQIGDYPSPAANPASSGWEQAIDAFATSGTPLTNLPKVSADYSPVTRTGTWTSSPNDLFTRYLYSNQVGATLNYSFNGSGVEVFGHPEGEDGIMNVYVDGSETATVDEFNPLLDKIEDDANDDQLMYAIDGLLAGNHTIEIQVANGHDPNAVNPGYYTQIDGFIPLPAATLPAPTGLTATTVSDSQINLSWNPVSGASTYDLYRSTTSGGEGSTPVATGITGTSTPDEGLAGGVTYYYTVAGVSGGNAGLPSAEASAATSGGTGGTITGAEATASSGYNLTTLGTSDWAHWGRGGSAANFDHDASGGSQISNVTKLGPGGYGGWTYSARDVIWTNGSPTPSDAGDDGYIWANNAIGAGYSFTVPADTTSRTLAIYLGGAGAGGTLTAALSDNSASSYSVSVSGSGNFQDLVTLTYNAAAAGKTLTLTYDKTTTIGSAAGSVDLIAAWLTGPPAPSAPSITTNPQSQSVTSGTPVSFAAAATGSPTPAVQWQVSTNGGSSYSTIAGATSTTLSIGAASVSETGYEYEAIFTDSGGTTTTTPATLTVTPSASPTVTTNPQSQSVASGAPVTFTAAATGSPTPTVQWYLSTHGGVSFAPISGATSTTLSIGAATVSETGYQYEAIFTNTVGTAATSAATLTVTQPSGGSLVGSYSTAAASYNLTTLGTTDWAHWGRGGTSKNFDHDKSGGSQISNVTKLGSGSYGGYTYSARKVIWTNGTPTASNSGDDGYIWANNAIGAGYSFTVPASTTSHTLYIYLGGASSGGTLTAHLSDSSAANYTATISGSSNYQDVVKLTFNAASASQTLTISWVKSQTIGSASGSVDLIAAWLQ